ncbi:unnamed protein product [Symbiodinium natans]|uniref:Uncharacterized protein n=1 Tax=Symbiodinium natans TaxID=878477 RepID=A0A812GX92_9DINO|nr:unnamed protein product [Symbiodinium natans]
MSTDTAEEDPGLRQPVTPPEQEEAPASGAGEGETVEGQAEKDAEDSDDAWGDWTKKGKEEEKEEDDEEDGWGDWTKAGMKDGKASKKKEKIVNPFTLLLQKGKGKGNDNGNSGRHGRRDRGGGRRDGKGNSRNLAAKAREEALARERMAAFARTMLHRHIVPPKMRPPRPPLMFNLPPRPPAFSGGSIPVRPGMTVAARPMFVPIMQPGAPPGAWMNSVPPPPLPFRPAIPPRPPTGPSARATPSAAATPSQQPPPPPPEPPRQKARPTPRASLARSVPRPTTRPPQPNHGSAKPSEPSKPPKPTSMKPPEPSKPPKGAPPLAENRTNGVKRPREEGFAEELVEWLNSLDKGKGVMMEYHEAMSQHCSSWQELIEWAVQDLDTKKMVFKLSFLESTKLKKVGHKIMFATGFRKLIKQREDARASSAAGPPAVPEPSVQAASLGQRAPRTPPKPQPKAMPLRRGVAGRMPPKETAELEPMEEMEEVACEPLEPEEDVQMNRLWQDLCHKEAPEAADEAPADHAWGPEDEEAPADEAWGHDAPDEAWGNSTAYEAHDEASTDQAWGQHVADDHHEAPDTGWEASAEDLAAELEEEVAEDPELGRRFAAAMKEVYRDEAQAEDEEEIEIPAKVPISTPPARARPFSAFGAQTPQMVPPRHAAASPGARTARPPHNPPPARLLQGRQSPSEPARSPQAQKRPWSHQ